MYDKLLTYRKVNLKKNTFWLLYQKPWSCPALFVGGSREGVIFINRTILVF